MHDHEESLMGSRHDQGPSPSILLVEDDPGVLYVLVRLFGPEYSVRTATNGRQAWDSILAHPPDLVITDLHMPGMNGLELLQRIRASPLVNGIPVIVITGDMPQNPQSDACLQFNAVDYFTKPFSVAELRRRVVSLLCQPGERQDLR